MSEFSEHFRVFLLCCVALTFQVKNNPPLKLRDGFCVGWVGNCPLPLWGPAGRGSICFCSLFVSLWGRSPAHQNVVFLSGPCLSVVMWTLWAKPVLFLVLPGGGETAQQLPDTVLCCSTNWLQLLWPKSCWGSCGRVAGSEVSFLGQSWICM